MAVLTEAMLRRIKRDRAKRWIQAFTIQQYFVRDDYTGDLYDEPVEPEPMVATEALGNYEWRDRSKLRGAPGGEVDEADLILCTDLDYSGALIFSGSRLVVEGQTLAITSVNFEY